MTREEAQLDALDQASARQSLEYHRGDQFTVDVNERAWIAGCARRLRSLGFDDLEASKRATIASQRHRENEANANSGKITQAQYRQRFAEIVTAAEAGRSSIR